MDETPARVPDIIINPGRPDCAHEVIMTKCNPERLVERESGPLRGVLLHVEARCGQCDMPFVFTNLPARRQTPYDMPTVSMDGREAHLPLTTSSKARPFVRTR
jgi:hypothetical protein